MNKMSLINLGRNGGKFSKNFLLNSKINNFPTKPKYTEISFFENINFYQNMKKSFLSSKSFEFFFIPCSSSFYSFICPSFNSLKFLSKKISSTLVNTNTLKIMTKNICKTCNTETKEMCKINAYFTEVKSCENSKFLFLERLSSFFSYLNKRNFNFFPNYMNNSKVVIKRNYCLTNKKQIISNEEKKICFFLKKSEINMNSVNINNVLSNEKSINIFSKRSYKNDKLLKNNEYSLHKRHFCSVDADEASEVVKSKNNDNKDINKFRNVAIIAHVDHGKTTLVDKLLKEGGEEIKEERLMDSNVLEKERGITILSKVTRIEWNGYILNIIDTPGHSDFGGEVERILSLVDGFCLIIDIVEGPKTQTKFVLQKALQNERCKGIVVINKVDRESDRKQGDCENEIFDLFLNFVSDENQMEYNTLYASAKNGWVCKSWEDIKKNNHPEGMRPLLEAIIEVIPPPEDKKSYYLKETEANKLKEKQKDAESLPANVFGFLVTMVEYVEGVGVIVTGKIYCGEVKKAETLFVKSSDGMLRGQTVIKNISVTKGRRRETVLQGETGDIVSLVTHRGIFPNVADTLCNSSYFPSIKSNAIDPPVICVIISPNTSPLAGTDGIHLTLQAIGKRLKKEGLTNVGIEVVECEKKDSYEVRGRGELQLGILIETLRREGFEMTVSPPTVVYKKDENNKILEPWERFTVEIPTSICASVIDKISMRNAEILDMKSVSDSDTQLIFKCSSRNFLGMRTYLRDLSKGSAVVMSEFDGYREKLQQKVQDRNGVIISSTPGLTTAFSMDPIQSKGILFHGEGMPTYAGMIIGEHYSANDIEMNAVKVKPVQHLRQKGSEEIIRIAYKPMSIENCLGYINEDEQIEVTPKRICMRKKYLTSEERKAASRANFIKK